MDYQTRMEDVPCVQNTEGARGQHSYDDLVARCTEQLFYLGQSHFANGCSVHGHHDVTLQDLRLLGRAPSLDALFLF